MRVRVLHAKLYAYALPGSTARQLFISSTLLDSSSTARTARQTSTDLDRPRQTSTPRHMESGSTGSTVTRQARQARPRQHLDSASTEPRQLDSSTARAQCTVVRSIRAGRGDTPQRQRTRSNTRHNAQPRPPVSGPAGARPRRGELGCVVRDGRGTSRCPGRAVSSVENYRDGCVNQLATTLSRTTAPTAHRRGRSVRVRVSS